MTTIDKELYVLSLFKIKNNLITLDIKAHAGTSRKYSFTVLDVKSNEQISRVQWYNHQTGAKGDMDYGWAMIRYYVEIDEWQLHSASMYDESHFNDNLFSMDN